MEILTEFILEQVYMDFCCYTLYYLLQTFAVWLPSTNYNAEAIENWKFV